MNFEKTKQPELAKHDSSILDLAFIMDCTGSMGSYIHNATQSIRKIVEEIVSLEKSDVRLALIEYRDHEPQESTFVTRVHDFTESIKEMKNWLENCSAVGGGDQPEAVADGLHAALKLSWREKSTKICVLISDAPPHGINSGGDSFPNGCPDGIDPIKVVNELAEKAVTLYCVGCEPALLPFKEFFSALAYKTGGQYVPLRNAELLAKVIVGGAVEEISLEKLMADVQEEVEKQTQAGVQDEKVISQAVEARLKSKGVKTNQLLLNDSSLEKASESAVKYSKLNNLEELRNEYKPDEGSFSSFTFSPCLMEMPMRKMDLAADGGPRPMRSSAPRIMLEKVATPLTSHEETYTVKTDDISYAQSERLVQKALKRSNK